ncbi:MAG: ArsC family reductase [gamma proteobacterium symbiont of Bathyaustriella thionipta]|nr:ArsC family reductase [gamma proteobacterium symbiont of Bathyaustriella thionipta]
MPEMYGIPNCDSIRKARKWLKQQGIEYQFHDFKKEAVDPEKLDDWMQQAGWETLLNRRGTTWRKLAQEVRERIDEATARRVMLEQPSSIKRPVLVVNGKVIVGFSEEVYQQLFTHSA